MRCWRWVVLGVGIFGVGALAIAGVAGEPGARAEEGDEPYRRCVAKQNAQWKKYADNCDGWNIIVENQSALSFDPIIGFLKDTGLSSSKPFVRVKPQASAHLQGQISLVGGPKNVSARYVTSEKAYPGSHVAAERTLMIAGTATATTVSCGYTHVLDAGLHDFTTTRIPFPGFGCTIHNVGREVRPGVKEIDDPTEPIRFTFVALTAEENGEIRRQRA